MDPDCNRRSYKPKEVSDGDRSGSPSTDGRTAVLTILITRTLMMLPRVGMSMLGSKPCRGVVTASTNIMVTLTPLTSLHVITFYSYSCGHCLTGPDGAATSQDGRGSGE
jgi:hypothetical protein